jgi:trans-AT polyketide synthase/acyltransferase/oxidoreductase domain-containing protein
MKRTETALRWRGDEQWLAFSQKEKRAILADLSRIFSVVRRNQKTGFATAGELKSGVPELKSSVPDGLECMGVVPACEPSHLGSASFCEDHGAKAAYQTGAMANGIASEGMVTALGRAGFLASFGSAGLPLNDLERSIRSIQSALPNGPYAFNLINTPQDPELEARVVDLYLNYGVRTIEAAAFLDLSLPLVRYRVTGLARDEHDRVITRNKIMAKVSRRELVEKFMMPPPERLLAHLLEKAMISNEQASLAKDIPMADDITIEADSGGHTDNRPLISLLPATLSIRDQLQEQLSYKRGVRIGVAGGISTPQSVLAAFMMGADYVVSGSVNQSSREAGTSNHVKRQLAEAELFDVMMAPSADMFEMGVKVQVLKRGSLFPMRAQKLYELYRSYDSWENLPSQDQAKLEKQFFQKDFNAIWEEVIDFFQVRAPLVLKKAQVNPKFKMALVFRWYLGQASIWAIKGDPQRVLDYQIWCGPSMGAFNNWVKGSYLEQPENRSVVDIAHHLTAGACYLYRAKLAKFFSSNLDQDLGRYIPEPLKEINNYEA